MGFLFIICIVLCFIVIFGVFCGEKVLYGGIIFDIFLYFGGGCLDNDVLKI